MKAVTTAVMIAGLLLGTAVVGAFGFTAVGRTLLAVGWAGFAIIVSYHLGVIGFLGLCWHLLARRSGSALSFMWGRLIRESGAEVLPLSQVGGYIMGARAASLLGVPSATATASTVVDVTLEAFGQLGYTLLGLGIMLIIRPGNQVGVWSAFGVVIGVVAVTAFVVVQRHGLTKVEGLLGRVAPGWLGGMARHVGSLRQAIDAIYRRPVAVTAAALLHFAAWVASGVEAWIAFDSWGAGWASVRSLPWKACSTRYAASRSSSPTPWASRKAPMSCWLPCSACPWRQRSPCLCSNVPAIS